MKSYSHDSIHLPGTWKEIKTPAGLSATFVCPDCSTLGLLDNHTIADDGAVSPSVVCDCGFHEIIKLEGWKVL